MVLRGVKNEGYAENVATTTIDLASLNRQQIREEDLNLVHNLINEFTEEQDDSDDPIDRLIEQRLQAIGNGPMSGLQDTVDGVAQNQQNSRNVDRLERKIDSLENQIQEEKTNGSTQTQEDVSKDQTQESEKEIDELFEGDSSDEQDNSEPEDENEDVVPVSSSSVSDAGVPDDVGPDVPDNVVADSDSSSMDEEAVDDIGENSLEDVDEGLEDAGEPTFSSEDADE